MLIEWSGPPELYNNMQFKQFPANKSILVEIRISGFFTVTKPVRQFPTSIMTLPLPLRISIRSKIRIDWIKNENPLFEMVSKSIDDGGLAVLCSCFLNDDDDAKLLVFLFLLLPCLSIDWLGMMCCWAVNKWSSRGLQCDGRFFHFTTELRLRITAVNSSFILRAIHGSVFRRWFRTK